MKRLTQEEMKEAIKQRSPNFEKLSPREQWEEDKELGVLDYVCEDCLAGRPH